MYRIGIIDDDTDEMDAVERTIKTIVRRNNIITGDLEFKRYSLDSEAGKLTDNIIKEVMQDIEDFYISLLIIDYKIIVSDELIKGSEVFEKIKNVASDFPTIIMTNVVEDSKENNYVDPDKIYEKSEFFKLKEYATEKTENIFRNIKRYQELRSKTQDKLDDLQKKLVDGERSQEIVNEIVETEVELDKYIPSQVSYIDKALNPERLKEVIELIREANELLE